MHDGGVCSPAIVFFMAIILLLVDGVGIAPPAPTNPVAGGLPKLQALLGCEWWLGGNDHGAHWRWHAIDATLGVPGLPQSGTGHATLWGGFNAPQAIGRHQPSYPTIALRERLTHESLFHAVQARGKRVAWANAYLPGYADAVAARRLRHTAATWAVLQTGLPLRGVSNLLAGTAVSWDIDQRLARTRPDCEALPIIAPETAGLRLAQLAHAYDLVAFETYLPDLAGHGRIPHTPAQALQLADGLLCGVVRALRPGDTLIVTSDHGNSEDMTSSVHTRNPVPLLAVGPGMAACDDVSSLDQVAHAVLRVLDD